MLLSNGASDSSAVRCSSTKVRDNIGNCVDKINVTTKNDIKDYTEYFEHFEDSEEDSEGNSNSEQLSRFIIALLLYFVLFVK